MCGRACTSDTLDGWSKDGEVQYAQNPAQGPCMSTVRTSARRPASRLYIHQYCCWPHANCGRKTRGVKEPYSTTARILCWYACLTFFVLMASVQGCQGGVAVAWRARVEDPNIKNVSCCLSPQNPCALMSACYPLSTLAVLC